MKLLTIVWIAVFYSGNKKGWPVWWAGQPGR